MRPLLLLWPLLLAALGTAFAQVRINADLLLNLRYRITVGTTSREFTLTDGDYQNYDTGWAASLGAEWIDHGDLDGDDHTDAATILFTNGGDADAVMTYLVVVTAAADDIKQRAAVLLGDRISIQSVVVDDDRIALRMVVSAPGDAFALPTRPVHRVYRLAADSLLLVFEQQAGLSASDVRLSLAEFSSAAPAMHTLQMANHPGEPPFMNGYPDHLLFNLSGELGSAEPDPRTPQLRVFPVADYRALFHAAERAAFERQLATLQNVLRNGTLERTDTLDILPTVEAAPLFFAQAKLLHFSGGRAVRYLTQYAQEQSVIANGNLFLTVQGLTSDGRYYIAAYLPLRTRLLPESYDQASEDLKRTVYGDNAESYRRYLEQTVNMLNVLKSADFEPELGKLDRLIESLVISR